MDKNNRSTEKQTKKRATFHLSEDYLMGLKALAYYDRETISETLHDAIRSYLKARRVDLPEAIHSFQITKNKQGYKLYK